MNDIKSGFDLKTKSFGSLATEETKKTVSEILEAIDKKSNALNLDLNLDDKTPHLVNIINRAIKNMHQGNFYQCTLSTSVVTILNEEIYWHEILNNLQEAAMTFCFQDNEKLIFGSTPEYLFKKQGTNITCTPIKGTIKRDADHKKDIENKELLQNSKKESAELSMVVDVLRNDLSTICVPGTVNTEKLSEILELPYCYHLVSTITGQLQKDFSAVDTLLALHPYASIVGAPKIAATRFIAENENVPRGVFTGAIGGFYTNGDAEIMVGIRIGVLEKKQIKLFAGAGITVDSNPVEEALEIGLKMENIIGNHQ